MLWVLLPLVPALRELLRPTDAFPLDAVGRDSGGLTVFAEGFREYLRRTLPADAESREAAGSAGALSDGTPYVQLTESMEPLRAVTRVDGVIPCVVLADAPVSTTGGETFMLEVLARRPWSGGSDTVYRALLAEEGATLGERSTVLRWVHVEGDLFVGRESLLDGRASATGVLYLEPGVQFRRVMAAPVVAGRVATELPPALAPVMNGTAKHPLGARRERGFTRIDGDYNVPRGATVFGSLVVMGNLTLEAGARVGGSIKSHGDCILHEGALVDGSLVSRGRVVIGSKCRISGSLVAEKDARIGPMSSVGSLSSSASLTAWSIELHEGAQVFGAVTARDTARVV